MVVQAHLGQEAGESRGKKATFKAISLGNRPELTALRAPLALALLVFHQNTSIIVGAPTMMITWFVLSGFLITSILLRDHAINAKISIKKFYARRALRLLPALYMMIVAVYIYAAFVHVGDARQRINGDALASIFYYMDYRQAFGHEPFLGFFGHVWSLSVEEQFYAIWAPVMAIVLWKWSRKAALVLTIAGTLAVVANREYLWFSTRSVPRVYFAFDTRADAIFVGCILGFIFSWGVLSDMSVKQRKYLAVLAGVSTAFMAWVTVSMSLYSAAPYVWGQIVAEVGAALILAHVIASPNGWYAKTLRIRPLVHIGQITYAIYLFHWPIYVIINAAALPFLDSWGLFAVRVGVTLVFAEASWFLVERRMLKLRSGPLSS